MRSIINALSMELFGKSLVLADFPERMDLVGLGLSDWEGYGDQLARKFTYTNTFYHREPYLDIANIDASKYNKYDFIISSDVFEHVSWPASRAFQNAFRMLKPGGLLILTVPYLQGETKEHYPGVSKFVINQEGEEFVLIETGSEGAPRKFTNLTFHGGPGTVVELRIFGEDSLARECDSAGFIKRKLYAEPNEEFGICWNPYVPENAPYRPMIYGLDTPPWSLRKPTVMSPEL